MKVRPADWEWMKPPNRDKRGMNSAMNTTPREREDPGAIKLAKRCAAKGAEEPLRG